MAQTSSAQREPSMEEILSSIRRIIEDNDAAGRRQAGEPEQARAPVQTERTIIEVDAFRNELRPQPVESRVPESRIPESRIPESRVAEPAEHSPAREIFAKKPTLADVHAQIVAEAAALPSRWDETDAYEQPEAQRSASHEHLFAERLHYERSPDDIQKAIENSRAAREDARALLGIPEPANSGRAVEPARTEALPHHEVRDEQEVREEQYARFDAVSVTHTDSDAAKPGLLSERVERQVTASFTELSEAFAARSRKTFDEMAEEMIAPLLRDWMENNLPTLVERLVREEIERVARGAQ